MKRVISCALAAILALPLSAFAADEMARVIASVCDYTKANDRGNLRKKLDDAGLDLRKVYEGISCPAAGAFEGGSLLRLAAAFGSVDAATFIAAKIGKNGLNKPERDGKTVIAWAEAKAASGDATTKELMQPVVDLLKSKAQ